MSDCVEVQLFPAVDRKSICITLNNRHIYHHTLLDTHTFRNAVVWLEKTHICKYKDDNCGGLKHINSETWSAAFAKYLNELECPLDDSTLEQLDWLAGFAVQMEYGKNDGKYRKLVDDEEKTSEPTIQSSNPLDQLDFESSEFKNGVDNLAKLLHVTPHVNHHITFKAISKLVQQRLSPQALENLNSVISKETAFPVNEMNMMNNLTSGAENDAVQILRLLYIQNLRQLQTLNNETIVATQQITANPKTDTKLGKVGF